MKIKKEQIEKIFEDKPTGFDAICEAVESSEKIPLDLSIQFIKSNSGLYKLSVFVDDKKKIVNKFMDEDDVQKYNNLINELVSKLNKFVD